MPLQKLRQASNFVATVAADFAVLDANVVVAAVAVVVSSSVAVEGWSLFV